MSVLEELAREGFKDTHKTFAHLPIYKSEKEYVLYNPLTQKIYLRYNIEKSFIPKGWSEEK